MAKHAWKFILGALVLVIGLLALSGPTTPTADKPAAPPAAVETPKIETRKTVGKTTQNVLNLADAVAQGACGSTRQQRRKKAASVPIRRLTATPSRLGAASPSIKR